MNSITTTPITPAPRPLHQAHPNRRRTRDKQKHIELWAERYEVQNFFANSLGLTRSCDKWGER
jgi:hypothetical protein